MFKKWVFCHVELTEAKSLFPCRKKQSGHSCRRLRQRPPLSRTSWWTVLTPIKTVSLSSFIADIFFILSACLHTVGDYCLGDSVVESVSLFHIQSSTSLIPACKHCTGILKYIHVLCSSSCSQVRFTQGNWWSL